MEYPLQWHLWSECNRLNLGSVVGDQVSQGPARRQADSSAPPLAAAAGRQSKPGHSIALGSNLRHRNIERDILLSQGCSSRSTRRHRPQRVPGCRPLLCTSPDVLQFVSSAEQEAIQKMKTLHSMLLLTVVCIQHSTMLQRVPASRGSLVPAWRLPTLQTFDPSQLTSSPFLA